MNKKLKVFVGLSGGVDSSVSAALLQESRYEVIGVFIRVWQPDFFQCGWKDDRLDAMRVCAKLGIQFRELNLEKEYKKEVVYYMIREYKAGRTPNPDVSCNRFIKFGLITADKKDSQGLCFVGKVDMKEFLSHYIKQKNGEVKNEMGEMVGEHTGAAFYTIGERLLGGYVVAKDMKKNEVIISNKNAAGELARATTEVIIKDCNWVSGAPEVGKKYFARMRYRQMLQFCRLSLRYDRSLIINHNALVNFDKPQTVAPGQSLVIYDGEVLLGGG